ncbi:MAG: molybdopterin molybdotransferase MoeA [Bacteriovoracaceae bacterium]|nr:molybdopterin molybdotransferase MoeA [Bacteriovoracaceae bacterium]
MIDVQTAEELVLRHSLRLPNELIDLENLEGRVLSCPVKSTRKQPPFDRVAMDGIAINYNSLSKNSFPIEGIQKAGRAALTLEKTEAALEVMTGAVLPIGTDTVIPYEKISIEDGLATINENVEVEKAQNIHFEASDYSEGEVLLNIGQTLNSTSIAIIASQGLTKAEVVSFPRIAIISTGDELIEPGKECKPWQIWRSNAYGIKAELKGLGVPDSNIELFHLEDKREVVFSALTDILENFETLIISGGVSMGKFDFVQSVMADLGVETRFYKIKQKPGKPMFFGTGKSEQTVFALPGNPVSALVCMRRYVIPSLCKSLNKEKSSYNVVLSEDVTFKKDFALFKAVTTMSADDGFVLATPLNSNGSGDFSSLGESQGFIELPASRTEFKAGEVFKFFPWSSK